MNWFTLDKANLVSIKHLVGELEHLASGMLGREFLEAVRHWSNWDCFGVFNHKRCAIYRAYRRHAALPWTHCDVHISDLRTGLGMQFVRKIAPYTTEIKEFVSEFNRAILHFGVDLRFSSGCEASITMIPLLEAVNISSEQSMEAICFGDGWQSRHNKSHLPMSLPQNEEGP